MGATKIETDSVTYSDYCKYMTSTFIFSPLPSKLYLKSIYDKDDGQENVCS